MPVSAYGVLLSKKEPGFKTIKSLHRRMQSTAARAERISTASRDVPLWQRGNVWRAERKGLLALSILQQYPIGQIVLWRKPNGVRVPIDGRQRLTAIHEFLDGALAIPDEPEVPTRYRNKKFPDLTADEQDRIEEYELALVQYDSTDTPEDVASDIFVRLQGGVPLTKTEVRAALGGRVAKFVGELTATEVSDQADDSDEDGGGAVEAASTLGHPFFQLLKAVVPEGRKAHRAICDVLLLEHLVPGGDKHWSSLKEMYQSRASTLSEPQKRQFSESLRRFASACTVRIANKSVLLPQLRSSFLILTYYRAWRALEEYAFPASYRYSEDVEAFETQRAAHPNDVPYVQFTSFLSNAGYAKNRSDGRHEIIMSFVLARHPGWKRRDGRRSFTRDQKVAIWSRAERQCQWIDAATGARCSEKFPDFALADADHIVLWSNGGPTTMENGRLLCQRHNRAPRPIALP